MISCNRHVELLQASASVIPGAMVRSSNVALTPSSLMWKIPETGSDVEQPIPVNAGQDRVRRPLFQLHRNYLVT